jgi:hypothetical protein
MSMSGNQLTGSIGVAGIVFLVVAAASPLTTVAGSLPVMIALGNGAGAPLTYVIAASVLLVFSVGYAAMSSAVTDTGAFYAYVTKGLATTSAWARRRDHRRGRLPARQGRRPADHPADM